MNRKIVIFIGVVLIVIGIWQIVKTNEALGPTVDSYGNSIVGPTWVWEKTEMNDGSIVEPGTMGDFAVTFDEEGKISGETDCNGFFGEYDLGRDNSVTFGPFVSTLMYCEGSQEDKFVQMVEDSTSYMITAEGKLVLLIKFDSGSVIFVRK